MIVINLYKTISLAQEIKQKYIIIITVKINISFKIKISLIICHIFFDFYNLTNI